MSSLSFCNLDQAFNNLSEKSKKKVKKKNNSDSNSNKNDNLNPLSNTYVNNNEFVENMNKFQKPDLDMLPNPPEPQYTSFTNFKREQPIDMLPNEKHINLNEESIHIFKNMQEQILKLTEELNKIKSNSNSNSNKNNSSNFKVIENFNNKSITFDNDQFNELLLYIFTGIFILYIIDHMYKFGKKSF